GAPLARFLDAPMDEVRAATLLRGVCNALSLAHGKGIVHRDLKPDNIFVCPDADLPSGERTKLLDFGIAKVSIAANDDRSATKAGIVMGTPTYMSPEQCKGAGAVDHRADLYSLGCILYEALCGVPPFEAEGAGELIAMHLFVEPKPPRECNASISPEAERLILDLLAKDPAKRPSSAAEVSQRLASLARGAGWTATPASGIPVVAVTGPYETQPPPEPTTLSGAASQSILEHPRKHRVLWLGAIGVVAAVVAVIAIVSSSHSNGVTHAATTPILPAPAPAPTPEPPKRTTVEPKASPSTPPPVGSTTSPLEAPDAPRPATVKVKKPITKPAPPHHIAKPASPPPDAGSAAPKILIEKDL
ncbi:MAG TPA: protein kinase, partial [Kofleriaceae bacterium]|nr:protein kinase [Kofleriaceae bacterium]